MQTQNFDKTWSIRTLEDEAAPLHQARVRHWIPSHDGIDFAVVDVTPPWEDIESGILGPRFVDAVVIKPRFQGIDLRTAEDFPVHVYVLLPRTMHFDPDRVETDTLEIKEWAVLGRD